MNRDGIIDKVEVLITPTGLIVFYLAHNGVRLHSSKTLKGAQSWLKRRPAEVVKTTWQHTAYV